MTLIEPTKSLFGMKNAVFFPSNLAQFLIKTGICSFLSAKYTMSLSKTIYQVDYSYGRSIFLKPHLAPFKCLDDTVFYSVTENGAAERCLVLGD